MLLSILQMCWFDNVPFGPPHYFASGTAASSSSVMEGKNQVSLLMSRSTLRVSTCLSNCSNGRGREKERRKENEEEIPAAR